MENNLFQELTENQIEEYTESIFKGDEGYTFHKNTENYKEEILSLFKNTKTEFKEILFKIQGAIQDLNLSNYNSVYETCNEISDQLHQRAQKLGNIARFYGEPKQETASTSSANIEIKLEYDKYFKIVFPYLLPKRIKSDNTRSITANINEYKYFSEACRKAFNQFRRDHKLPSYNSKVVLCFTHFFENEYEVMDADNLNFEPKDIQNIICSNMLPDDSLSYVSHYIDYKIGDYRHTEITIIPEEDFRKGER